MAQPLGKAYRNALIFYSSWIAQQSLESYHQQKEPLLTHSPRALQSHHYGPSSLQFFFPVQLGCKEVTVSLTSSFFFALRGILIFITNHHLEMEWRHKANTYGEVARFKKSNQVGLTSFLPGAQGLLVFICFPSLFLREELVKLPQIIRFPLSFGHNASSFMQSAKVERELHKRSKQLSCLPPWAEPPSPPVWGSPGAFLLLNLLLPSPPTPIFITRASALVKI